MFIHEVVETKNTKNQLKAGTYKGICTLYSDPDTQTKLFLFEYGLKEKDDITVAEVLIADEKGDLFFRDFMQLPDDLWRDSYGKKADTLGELLPAEVLHFVLIERIEIEDQIIEETV